MRRWTHVRDAVKQTGLTAVQLHGEEEYGIQPRSLPETLQRIRPPNDFPRLSRENFRYAGRTIRSDGIRWRLGWSRNDEAYKGKRVHKIHVAKNGDLFLETHGFRPGIVSGVLLDSSNR